MNVMEDYYEKPDEPLKRRRAVEYAERIIAPLFPADRDARIVDLGCGYGLFLKACHDAGYRNCEGVERERTFITYTEKELGLDGIVCDDLFDYLKAKDEGFFDVIVALNIVEHVRKDRIKELFRLVRSRLKRGGVFIMEVPNADSPLGVHILFSDLTHELAFTRKLAGRLLRNAGFIDIEARYFPTHRNPLIRLLQFVMAKAFGFERAQFFSGNIVLIGRAS